jgi:hypothetical protein
MLCAQVDASSAEQHAKLRLLMGAVSRSRDSVACCSPAVAAALELEAGRCPPTAMPRQLHGVRHEEDGLPVHRACMDVLFVLCLHAFCASISLK